MGGGYHRQGLGQRRNPLSPAAKAPALAGRNPNRIVCEKMRQIDRVAIVHNYPRQGLGQRRNCLPPPAKAPALAGRN